jgi:hypothetical protein
MADLGLVKITLMGYHDEPFEGKVDSVRVRITGKPPIPLRIGQTVTVAVDLRLRNSRSRLMQVLQ